ncbi:hypothetical protein Tco_1363358 [Tanacetum coccineum]
MSTQQDIYAAGSENCPPMLNKENYFPWSSRLLRYAKSRPNGKLIYNSIINGPYVRRMIPEPGDAARAVPVPETFTSTDEESIKSYYHRFSKLMNDFKRNKHFPEKIAIQNPGAQNVGNQNGLIVIPRITNQNGNGNVVSAWAEGNANGNNGNQIMCYNYRGLGHLARNCTVRPQRRDVDYLQNQLLIAQKECDNRGPTTLVADETVHKEMGDSMERAATTAASLDAEQDNVVPGAKIPYWGDRPAQTRVLALENVKTAQDLEITSLKKIRIESSANKSLGNQEDASKQGRNIAESDQDEEILFVQEDAETQGRYDQDIDVTIVSAPITTAGVSVSTAEPSTSPTITTFIEDEDLIIAQTLMNMRSEKSKEKAKERGSKEKSSEPATRPTRGVTMQEPSESGTRRAFNEEVAKRRVEELKTELEEERVAKQREEEANLISWDNTQAMMEADYELAQRLQVEEQGELTIEERSRLFVELINKRKKHFAKLRGEKIKRKPPTKA